MNPFDMFVSSSGFKSISFDESRKLSEHRHAVHCCIYSPCKTRIQGCEVIALISMQMRFDGNLGFPGGLVDGSQTVLGALQRELVEEINLNSKLLPTDKNYLCSHVHAKKRLCCHFYAKDVTQEEFIAIERDALDSKDYGQETLGLVRVPLYTMIDGLSGFPTFLRNSFAGNAKDQLLTFLLQSKLMTQEEIQVALEKSKKV